MIYFFMKDKDPHEYDDMLGMSYPYRSPRRQMTLVGRAAQFAPFAALNGFEEGIDETARLTDERIVPGEDRIAEINATLMKILACIKEKPRVSVVYFKPDEFKKGGAYITHEACLKKFDEEHDRLIFDDGEQIDVEAIFEIEYKRGF